MRILLLNQVFWPDVAATAQHAHDLAKHLVAHGHDVRVIASRAIYGEKGASLARHETVDGVRIHRVARSFFGKAGILARCADFALFLCAALFKSFAIPRPDVVICLTTPPYISLIGWVLKRVRGVPYVCWLMDVYPDVLVAHGTLSRRSPITWALRRLNRFLLRRSARVVVLGRCMRQRVLEQAVPPSRVVHIGVWSDHEEVRPLPRDENSYRREWELGDRFVVMYSGNFGLAHDVQTMCDAAAALRNDDRIAFVFVGGGKRKAAIEHAVHDLGLGAAMVAPYQPRERLDELLSCGDLHLVSLLPAFEGLVAPSKLFGIMAAGRPTLFIGPAGSELGRIISEEACGMVVAPGDVQGLVRAILDLADDPGRCRSMGENARRALVGRYDRRHACGQWLALLQEVASEVAGSAQTSVRPQA